MDIRKRQPQTMAERDENEEWLDALAGKPNPSAESSFIRKALILRHAIQDHDSQLMGKAYDVETELQRLNARLSKEGLVENVGTSKSFAKRWAVFVAVILSAFTLGAITMRFAMMPAMEGVRSDGTILSVEEQKRFLQIVPLYVPDPSETMKAAVVEASRLGISFSVRAVDGGYDLVLEGLVPNSVAQESLKQVLGIRKSAAGGLQFEIRQKPKS